MSEPVPITDPEAARAFASAKPRSILMALMRDPRSLTGLHEALGFSLSLLHYHVAKLRRLGLVEVTRREARAGRSIAVYAATASSFAVPMHFVEPSRTDELRAQLVDALERDSLRRPPAMILYDLAEDGAARMRRIGDPHAASAAGEWWSRLRLSDRDAAALTTEMREIIARYGGLSNPGGKSYLLHLALAPS